MFEDFMFYLTTILVFCGGMSAVAFLAYTGHPWFALLVLLVVAGFRMNSNKTVRQKKD